MHPRSRGDNAVRWIAKHAPEKGGLPCNCTRQRQDLERWIALQLAEKVELKSTFVREQSHFPKSDCAHRSAFLPPQRARQDARLFARKFLRMDKAADQNASVDQTRDQSQLIFQDAGRFAQLYQPVI